MKKTLILILLIGSFTSLSAQKFGGRLYGGMTASQLDGDALGGFDLPGIRLGVGSNVRLDENFLLQLEIAFIQKGSRELPSDTSQGYLARLNYVEVPLLAEYRLNKLAFEAGPALDILANAREEYWNFVQEPEPPFNRVSLTGIVGISYYFSEQWSVNFRTAYSLTPVRPANVPYNPAIPRRIGGNGWRSANLSFAIYYNFRQPS